MYVVQLVLGFVLLTFGADVLVRGASRLARAAGVPSLIVGLTVVAFGTSAPELVVSVKACLAGQADLALGNVVGSNTFNVLFILGVSALIVPLTASRQLVRLDVPLMILASGGAWAFASDGRVGRIDGLVLLAGGVAYTVLLVLIARRERGRGRAETEMGALEPAPEGAGEEGSGDRPGLSVSRSLGLAAAGLGLLVLGGHWFVEGAVDLARRMGVSELLIGLTVVAAGTSLPEVATSIVASVRGERDVAIGNIVGSNLFNLLFVLGGASVVAPDGVTVAADALGFDVPVMVAVAVVCLPIFFTGGRIARLEGAVLLGYYIAYVAYLALHASAHASRAEFSRAVLWFAIPLTALGIVVSVVQSVRSRGRGPTGTGETP